MAGRLSDIKRLTEAGVDVVFNRTAKMPTRQYYAPIVTEVQMTRKIGSYNTVGNIGPAAEKPEGHIPTYDRIQHHLETTIESRTVSKAVEATLEKLKYDLENVVKNTFGVPLMRVMQTFKEREVADLYNDAFTTTGADGVNLIADDHPLQSSTEVNDNLATGPLTSDNLVKAKQKFNNIYDQAGDFYDTEPTHLLIHPNKQFQALAILESSLMAFELSNTKNVVNQVMPIKIVVNKYLDYDLTNDESPWFLLDRTMSDAGAILQVREGVRLDTWWEKGPQVFRGHCLEMYGSGIISPGYGIVGSTGA